METVPAGVAPRDKYDKWVDTDGSGLEPEANVPA
jgi:hypothetical protein